MWGKCLDVIWIPRKWMKTFWRRKYSTILVSLVVVSLQRELKPAIELAKKVQLVKFMKANDCQQVWSVKKGLLKTKMEVVTLPGPNKSLCWHYKVNRSLCRHYKVKWPKSKRLEGLGKIFFFYISRDVIKIRVSKSSSLLSITHLHDFNKYFCDVDLSPPEQSK